MPNRRTIKRQRQRPLNNRMRVLRSTTNVSVPRNTLNGFELKKYDTYVSGQVDYNGKITLLDSPSQGTGSTNRIGNSIVIRSIEFSGSVTLQGTSQFDTLRQILVLDNMGVNAPAISEILDATVIGSSSAIVALRNNGYMPRFKFYFDKLHKVTTGGGQQVTWKRVLNNINLTCYFIGASTFKNMLYLLEISNEANILNAPLAYTGVRIYYTDA